MNSEEFTINLQISRKYVKKKPQDTREFFPYIKSRDFSQSSHSSLGCYYINRKEILEDFLKVFDRSNNNQIVRNRLLNIKIKGSANLIDYK